MPHIAISMYPGRAEQVKRNLAQKIQDLVVMELKVDRAVVSVSVEEVAPEHWAAHLAKLPADSMLLPPGK